MSVTTANMSANGSRARLVGYWIATVPIAILFAVPGVALLAHVPHFTEEMAHLGYPAYFLTILGVWKISGAGIVLAPNLPRLKEWAYAGMIFDATSAAASRAAVGDDAFQVVFPLVIAAGVMASWALRPTTRRLPDH